MELRQLETFVAVVEQGSFTKAADALFLTQPAVTRQIAALEQELHTRLLERMGRKVEYTAAGETLYRYATAILSLVKEGVQAVTDVQAGVGGRLAVGASNTAATYLLPGLLRRFQERYPGVELGVHTGMSSRVVEMVIQNRVDVGVVMDFRGEPELIEVPVGEYAMVAVVYPGHPLAARGGSVLVQELAGQALLVMEPGTNLREYVDRLLLGSGVEARVALELDNVETIKKMVEARIGIALLPQVAIEWETAAQRLVALPLADAADATRRLSGVYRRDKYLSAAMNAFLLMLAEEFGGDQEAKIPRAPPCD